jgi:hypothetical protein
VNEESGREAAPEDAAGREEEAAEREVEELDETADRLEDRTERLEAEVEERRREWEAKKEDSAVPGAQPEEAGGDRHGERQRDPDSSSPERG